MQNIGTIIGFDTFEEIVSFIKEGRGTVLFDNYHEPVGTYEGNLTLGVNTFDSVFYENDFHGMTEEPFSDSDLPDVIHVVFTKDKAEIGRFIGYQYN